MLTRRSLLMSGLCLPFAPALARAADQAAVRHATPATLVLSDISPNADIARLETIVRLIQARGLPLTLALAQDGGAGTLQPAHPALANWLLAASVGSQPGLEVALQINAFDTDAYARVRRASDEQAVFCKAINARAPALATAVMMARTVLTRTPMLGPQDGADLRAAGIRTVVRLAGNAEKSDNHPENGAYWFASNGMVNIAAPRSPRLRPSPSWEGPARLQRSLEAHVKAVAPVIVLELSFAELGALDDARLTDFITAFADTVEIGRAHV